MVAICYATGPYIINRKLSDLPALGVIASSLLLVAALAYAPAALVQLPHTWPSGRVIAAVLTLGVVCTALAFLLFFALIGEIGPVRSTVITYVNPAVAVTLGVLLLNEPLTGGIAVGFALILGGSVLARPGGAVASLSRGQTPAVSATGGCALGVARAIVIWPSLASTSTVSPSLNRPSRIAIAIGSWRRRWITRFSGRAP